AKVLLKVTANPLAPLWMHLIAPAGETKKKGSIPKPPVVGSVPMAGKFAVDPSSLRRSGSPSGLKQVQWIGLRRSDVAIANLPSGLMLAVVSFCPSGMPE